MFRTFLILASATLCAQDPTNAIPQNSQALRNAIAGLGKRPLPVAPQRIQLDQPPQRTCSAPLQSMQIDASRQFRARQVPAPEVEPMPRAAVPAPPCETATR